MRLLADLRRVIEGRERERFSSAALVELLQAPDDGRWDETFDARTLARLLVPYDVRPKQMRCGDAVVRGYDREDLVDAFSRYLAPVPDVGRVL